MDAAPRFHRKLQNLPQHKQRRKRSFASSHSLRKQRRNFDWRFGRKPRRVLLLYRSLCRRQRKRKRRKLRSHGIHSKRRSAQPANWRRNRRRPRRNKEQDYNQMERLKRKRRHQVQRIPLFFGRLNSKAAYKFNRNRSNNF